jgi:GDP-4-dehydro-6-deoxy-D-mannose reductase
MNEPQHFTQTSAPVLVTGGTGFAGSHLVEALIEKGYTNVHVTSLSGKPGNVTTLIPADHVHAVDLTDQKAVEKIIGLLQPASIYHLAAFASVSSSFDQGQVVLENNLKLQLSLLEAVRLHAPQARILIVGSGMEYDVVSHPINEAINEEHPLGPVSPYAVSKVIQDLVGFSYSHLYKLSVVRARPFNHIGEYQTTDFAVPSFAKQVAAIEKGTQDKIQVGNLNAVRDFTDVKDVVQAYILLMEKGQVGEVYNIGSGEGRTMQEVLDLLCSLSKTKIEVITDPARVRPLDVPSVIADISKIKQLGWTPQRSLKDTLERILEEWRQK